MSIEERLARDIAAVTGGVIVTDSDLRVARDAVDERIYGARRRDRLRRLMPAAAAAVVLVLVGVTAFLTLGNDDHASQPANPRTTNNDPDSDYLTGSAPTSALIAGVWRLDNGRTLVKFNTDGTVRFDGAGTLFSRPTTTGTYRIAQQVITVTTTANPEPSCIGATFRMRASLPAAGALRFVADPPFGTCSPLPVGQVALEQVLPTKNKDVADLVFSGDVGWTALSGKDDLYGVWLAEGGGYLLEIDSNGTYYVADASAGPVDTGRWSLRGPDLTLTSSASARCSAGDKLVLGSVQHENGTGTQALRGTVKQNTCGGAWTPAAWILLPNAAAG